MHLAIFWWLCRVHFWIVFWIQRQKFWQHAIRELASPAGSNALFWLSWKHSNFCIDISSLCLCSVSGSLIFKVFDSDDKFKVKVTLKSWKIQTCSEHFSAEWRSLFANIHALSDSRICLHRQVFSVLNAWKLFTWRSRNAKRMDGWSDKPTT